MNQLVTNSLLSDPDFAQAKRKILNLVEKHRSRITKVQPPNSSVVQTYEETIRLFAQYRGMPLFYPFIGSGNGNGALVELADGSIKYDFISGIGVHFGHCHPKLIEASLDAAVQDIVMQGHLIQNADSFLITELLIKHSGMDHCLLTSSGAMANENALKLIFQKKSPKSRILAFERCFMGRTLTLTQITDKPSFREGLPMSVFVDYLPFYDWKDPKGSTEKSVTILKKLIGRNPDKYAVCVFEMIQGEAGSYPGKTEFFLSLLKILKEANIAVLVDEVQTFGRTDHLFAFQHFGIAEYVDVVTVGKLLHACATLFKHEFVPKPGLISQTFTASTSVIAAAKVIVQSLLEEGYLGKNGKNMQIRKRIVDRLQEMESRYPERMEGPFGHGLMIAFTPFKGEKDTVIAFAKALFKAGVIGFTAGSDPTRIRFLVPAGGISFEEIDRACDILEETLKNFKIVP